MTREKSISLRGDGTNVNRYRGRKGATPEEVTLYVDVMGEHTVAELVAFLLEEAEMRPDMGNAKFNGGCFWVSSPATPEDVARWEELDARQEARAKEGRRQWYERLRAEFEGEDRDG